MTESITDASGRTIAPAQTWPEPAPDKPRTYDVTVRHRDGRIRKIHGIQFIVGFGNGALLCRSMDVRERVEFKDGSLEIEA